MMERIDNIDQRLTKLLKGFDKVAHSLSFEPVGDLNQVDLKSIESRSGLYLIEVCSSPQAVKTIEEWLPLFERNWAQGDFKNSFIPSCQKARMKSHTVLHEWMPLYLGKSKSIGKRIREHMYLEKAKRTFALKLQARNLLDAHELRLSVMQFDVINYDIIASRLEASVRRKLRPLVGRQ